MSTSLANPHEQPHVPDDGAEMSILVYVLGGLLYFIVCMPSIGQRGYPPVDPGLLGCTFLWIFPILFAVMLDGRPFRQRFRGLFYYCATTAFINASTIALSVPNTFSPLGTIALTITFTGPVHVIGGSVLAGVAHAVRTLARALAGKLSPRGAQVGKWTIVAMLGAATVGFPFAFRAADFAYFRHRGRATAETDWREGTAGIHADPWTADLRIQHRYDPATGLEIRRLQPWSKFHEGYNARIGELIAEHGLPPWSMKRHLVPDDELFEMLDSPDMDEVRNFPHAVNERIRLSRSGSNGVSIDAAKGGMGVGTGETISSDGPKDIRPLCSSAAIGASLPPITSRGSCCPQDTERQ